MTQISNPEFESKHARGHGGKFAKMDRDDKGDIESLNSAYDNPRQWFRDHGITAERDMGNTIFHRADLGKTMTLPIYRSDMDTDEDAFVGAMDGVREIGEHQLSLEEWADKNGFYEEDQDTIDTYNYLKTRANVIEEFVKDDAPVSTDPIAPPRPDMSALYSEDGMDDLPVVQTRQWMEEKGIDSYMSKRANIVIDGQKYTEVRYEFVGKDGNAFSKSINYPKIANQKPYAPEVVLQDQIEGLYEYDNHSSLDSWADANGYYDEDEETIKEWNTNKPQADALRKFMGDDFDDARFHGTY